MHTRIEVEHPLNELSTVKWIFWLDGTNMWLDHYIEMSRVSKRHKFIVNRNYNRLDLRQSNMTVEEVPLSEEVKSEALKQLVSQITIQKWAHT